MTGWTIHLDLRDDQTAEDAFVLADQLAEILRFATGGYHVTETTDWRVCRVPDWDADHTCKDSEPSDPWSGLPDGWTPAPGDDETGPAADQPRDTADPATATVDASPDIDWWRCTCGQPDLPGAHTNAGPCPLDGVPF